MTKKSICFVSLGNIYLVPYIAKYTSSLNCDYDIIYWDRHGLEEKISAKQVYSFHIDMDEGSSKISKLLGYFKFRKYALNIIRKNKYSGIILLQTSAGILMQNFLKKKYSGKYIIDIRDYTMENNPLFFAIEKELIENSSYSVISSEGYKNFLPKFNYTLVHNDFAIDEMDLKKFMNRKRIVDRIVISYIGLIRFHEQNKKVILKFKNDMRFTLRFIGKDANALQKFCKENHIYNVELIDWFPPEKTLDYYNDTDIIYNLYGNNTPLLDYALSNKLYYAAKLKMPIIVSPETYMEKVGIENGFGYSFNVNDLNACDDLFNYYNSIDWNIFQSNCDDFIKKINTDNENFNKAFYNFIDKI
jgi:hypothetical protein